MTKSASKTTSSRHPSVGKKPAVGHRYCSMRQPPPRVFSPNVGGERVRAIVVNASKWVNGTVLHYAFFENSGNFKSWAGTPAQKQVVKDAIRAWTNLGIGIRFEEVSDRAEAEVRIGFEAGDGHWSYIGRDVLRQGSDDRTLNLDPSAGNFDVDTACHELGHTLGLPHEHQNPKAGIQWDEEAVYSALAAPPNGWDRSTTYNNIISKISQSAVSGSNWDPNSIMHYAFEAGMILQPEKYRAGLTPAGGLSTADRTWIRNFYPPLAAKDEITLQLLQSERLKIFAGEQRNFLLKPTVTRYYEMRTFGQADTVAVLFERPQSGDDRYLSGDDDSGEDRNAYLRRRLKAGHTYVLRIRLYYASAAGETGVMWW